MFQRTPAFDYDFTLKKLKDYWKLLSFWAGKDIFQHEYLSHRKNWFKTTATLWVFTSTTLLVLKLSLIEIRARFEL